MRSDGWAAAGGAALLALAAGPAFAADRPARSGDASLRAEVDQLQSEVTALQGELEALRAQLATRTAPATPAAPPPAPIAVAPSPERAEPRVVLNEAHRFALQSADGEYAIGLTGDLQFDSGAYLDFHPASTSVGSQALSSGFNARRVRIGVAGTAFGSWSYAVVYDAGNASDQTAKGLETAQIVYGGLPGAAFEIGYSNTFFTLDQATSSNDGLFLERATPSDIATSFNAGDARANVGARFFGDRYWIGAYLTGPAIGDSHTLGAERIGAFQRAAFQALSGPGYSLHLGVGVDELFQAPNLGAGAANSITLGAAPELRIDPTALLGAGPIGTLANPVDGALVIDLESAATWNSLFWQGEYYRYRVDRRGLPSADFDGGYGEVSWTLTGEAHPYNRQAGAYYRIAPARPFSLEHGGWGAWELAARISYADLTSGFVAGEALSANPGAVDGGRQTAVTLGLNWYPDDFVRFLVDYNHVDVAKANGAAVKGAPLGAPVGASFDALSLRAQVAF
ncbi:MAG: OprO/OprP family phosphate-selective porin [Caulobacteraceae bacterium]